VYGIILAASLAACDKPSTQGALGGPLRAGDLVFQTSSAKPATAIGAATHSGLNHVGMVVHADGHLAVYEADGTVHTTPLDAWIARAPATFVARRLKDAPRFLTADGLAKLAATSKRNIGKPADTVFDAGDDKMYSSELIWKTYRDALGVDLGVPQPLRSLDLSAPEVKALLAQRYGKAVPLDTPVITPAQIFDSELLETVRDDRRGAASSKLDATDGGR